MEVLRYLFTALLVCGYLYGGYLAYQVIMLVFRANEYLERELGKRGK